MASAADSKALYRVRPKVGSGTPGRRAAL